MQLNQKLITFAYYFLSEAIILFLPLVIIMHFHYKISPPYLSYMLIVIVVCILFSYITHISNNYYIYFTLAPVLIVALYLIDFPVVLSVITSAILVWRYIRIRKQTEMNQEVRYLQITFILSIFIVILTKEIGVVVYAFLQLLILLIGYTIRQLSAISSDDRKQFDNKLWFYFLSFFSMGAIIMYFIFDFTRDILFKSWDYFTYLITASLGFIARLIGLINFTELDPPRVEEDPAMEGEGNLQDLVPDSNVSIIDDHTTKIYLIIAIVLISVLIYFIFRNVKNKFTIDEENFTDDNVTYEKYDKQTSRISMMDRLFKRNLKKQLHPVRRLIYDFEKKAFKVDKGRRAAETIEEWFERIDIDIDVSVYEKVRYGEQLVDREEVEKLRIDLLETAAKF